MKFILPLLFLLFPLSAAFGQKLPKDAISNYFSEYVDDQDFTVVYVSGKIFDLVKDADIDLEELDEEEVEAVFDVVKDIQGIRVLHTERNAMARWKEAKKRIPTDKYGYGVLRRTGKDPVASLAPSCKAAKWQGTCGRPI